MNVKLFSPFARVLAALTMTVVLQPFAADLSNIPLSTETSSVSVKPNIMFLLDTSGSMSQDYTPDWVNDNFNYCRNNSSYGKYCVFGMPPWNSPDFNSQYYSPDITYSPPTKYDGSSYNSMTSLNTIGWTAVPVDGYAKEPYLVGANGSYSTTFSAVNTTWNLLSNYPDLIYSTSAGGVGDPQRNIAQAGAGVNDYVYPELTGPTHAYVTYITTGAGGPYYYRISGSTMYCTDANYTNCKAMAAPDPSYSAYTVPYPAKYIWCNNSNLNSAATLCQRRRSDSTYKYVSLSGGTLPGSAGVLAVGSLTVTQAGSTVTSTTTSVTSIKITTTEGTYEILNGGTASATGVDGSSKRNSLATSIKGKISGGGGSCTYTATSSGNVVTIKSAQMLEACNGTLTITSSDATVVTNQTFGYSTKTVTSTQTAADNTLTSLSFSDKTYGGSATVKASYILTLNKLGITNLNSTTTVQNLTINGVDALGGVSVSVDGQEVGTGSAKDIALATAIANQINNYTSAAPDWTATVSGATITITAASFGSAGNNYYNNYNVALKWKTKTDAVDGVTHTVTITSAELANGKTPGSNVTLPAAIFKRTNIVPATTYPHTASRTDCADAVNCTYDEEMTNFANWFAYYRSRIQTMKTAASQAFVALDDRYRVGFIDIQGNNFLKLNTFDTTQKSSWFTKLFTQSTGASTPLREALSRVGRYYAGVTSGINSTTASDPHPIQYSCQQNYTIMTTDGYWNGNGGQKLDGSAMDNQDNTPPGGTTPADYDAFRSQGIYDGYTTNTTNASGGTSDGTLADVAYYYWKTDLIPNSAATYAGNNIGDNNVPSSGDGNNQQHMNTFTLGLGVDGQIEYANNYVTQSQDYLNLTNPTVTGCGWDSGCRWPIPTHDADTAVDDLWHAAVNGHGTYFSAKNPQEVRNSLKNALSAIQAKLGAASSSATSTPVITQNDNQLFLTTYNTGEWSGEVQAKTINSTTGSIDSMLTWTAQTQLASKTYDHRVIFTRNGSGGMVDFLYDSLDSVAQNYFNSNGKASTLPQYSTLTTAQKAVLTDGTAMVNFLRGDMSNDAVVFRQRTTSIVPALGKAAHVTMLGDMVNAAPKFVRAPSRSFTENDYPDFKTAQANRRGVLYVAANDGMLHAFAGSAGSGVSGGDELWAYVPRMIMPEMYQLASTNYGVNHTYFVDGSPEVEDVYDSNSHAWRTILVAGLDGGGMSDTGLHAGRGYYALDVTNPTSPLPLWEVCSDATLCSIHDSKLGYTFGNPLIGKRAKDGRWVVYVSSGYAKDPVSSTATQPGYLFTLDAITGAILETTSTGTDGLGHLNDYIADVNKDNTALYVYGGDLQGRVYEFDTSQATMTAKQIAKLSFGGVEQPITTRPIISMCQNKRLVMVGTGRYLGNSDIGSTSQNSVYGFTTDIPTANQTLNANPNMVKQNVNYTAGSVTVTTSTAVDLSSKYGWYIDFEAGSGERVNIDPILAQGNLVVATNIPSTAAGACNGVAGKSRIYDLDYCSGALYRDATKVEERDTLLAGVTKFFLTTGQFFTVDCDVTGTCDTKKRGAGGASFIPGAGRVSWRELLAN